MRHLLTSLFLLLSATFVQAQEADTELVTLETGAALRGWEGVGRLDIDGKGFCTAALLRESLILTAAHCVYGDDGKIIDASQFTFNAGLRSGRAEATRGIKSLVAHPDYIHRITVESGSVSVDIAVLQLDQPIRRNRIQPFRIAERPRAGDQVGIVSYGRGRAQSASLQEICSVRGRRSGMVVMTCDVDYGSSGSPVFMVQNGERKIVSVVSAMAQAQDGEKISLGTSLAEPLQALLAHYSTIGPANPGGTQRIIQMGERTQTGAKFVRP